MPQRYTVPQFIEAEAKIMGPISVRQFIILLIAVLLMFISWKFASSLVGGILILLWGGLGLALAFVKINGQSMHIFLLGLIRTIRKPRLRVWYKEYTNEQLQAYLEAEPPPMPEVKPARKELKRGRLSELSLLVNTGGAYNPG